MKLIRFHGTQYSLLIALTSQEEHVGTLSMTGSAVSRRGKGPNNAPDECFISETFSMNISCTEMSGREQQSGAQPLTVALHSM